MTEEKQLIEFLEKGEFDEIAKKAFDDNPAEAAIARRVLERNPGLALQRLNLYQPDPDKLGLTLRGQADIADVILGSVPDAEGRKLLQDHFTPARRVELLQGRGDLPAVAAYLATVEDIAQLLFEQILSDDPDDDGVKSYMGSIFAVQWAMKLRDHPEWDEILEIELGGGMTFMDHVVLGASLLSDDSDADFAAVLHDCGIDYADGQDRLDALERNGYDPRSIDPEFVELARLELAKRRAEVENAPRIQEAAKQAADELDF